MVRDCDTQATGHFGSGSYLAENRDRIAGSRGGEISRAWLEWTPQRSLAAMDEHDVETAMLSLLSPGVWFGDAEEACATARRINEHGAELVRNHSGRFGLFSRHRTKATVCSLRPELVGIV
jgi:6-methylsalicylate decarboxylase